MGERVINWWIGYKRMVIWWTEESKNIIGSGITFLKAVRQGMVGMVTIGNSKPHNMALHTLTLYLSKFSICKITWNNSFFFNLIYLFIYFYIYFGLCWVFVSVRGLSLVAASGGHSSSRCAGLFTIAASLAGEHRFQTCRLSSCGSRA